MMLDKIWKIKEIDSALSAEIAAGYGINPVVAKLLVLRGITKKKDIKDFFDPSFESLHNPFLLPDICRAIERVNEALTRNEKILIFGDRDVDGITSVNIMKSLFKHLKREAEYYIPSDEGYGMNKKALDKASADGVKLIITVDCGISNAEEIDYAGKLGMDVIVTDHHEPPENLPVSAVALVNPKVKYSVYPFKNLAGCGVALKFCSAMLLSESRFYNKDVVILDTETTGLSHFIDDVIELGAVKTRNGVVIDEFQEFIKPGRPISSEVTEVHGITNEMVKNASSSVDVMRRFYDFIGGDSTLLVAHNASFDMTFIRRDMKKALGVELLNEVYDTLAVSRVQMPFTSHSLPSLARELGFDSDKFHRAKDDAFTTMKLFNYFWFRQNTAYRDFIKENIDLAALGTIADVVEMKSENRALVKVGLKTLKKTKRPGLKKLFDELNTSKKEIDSKFLAWNIIPVLNAAGRMADARTACDLLWTKDKKEVALLAAEVLNLNKKRKNLSKTNQEIVFEALPKQCDIENDKIFVVAVENMEHGVTGIIASQIARKYGRPNIILIIEGGEAMGSGRSIAGFDITAAVAECSDVILKFGGHKQAVGLSVSKDRIEEFRNKIRLIADKKLTADAIKPVLEIDAEIDVSMISPETVRELDSLEPFGASNERPVFLAKGMPVDQVMAIGIDGKHLKILLKSGKKKISALAWNLGERKEEIEKYSELDLVFNIELNEWNGRESADLMLLDFRPCMK